MEYRVLARKYRPQTFADLVGQDILVRTLTNAFASGRIAHAFLLTGIRGIGKTTTARIIARALNCIGPEGTGGPTINPCGVCTHCKMIAESRDMDVLEMDAASHTGVDDIRDIIGTVQYLPSSARTKVYIIDEVHMLSNNAFNALLKTLEEPPPHVKFIFATTEIRKIPVTILSRCQRFDLKRVDTKSLSQHLTNIAGKESVAVEEEAMTLIAEAAEGSVRDSLSLLDQAIAHNADDKSPIAASMVRDMLGMSDKSQLFTLLEKLFAGAVADTLAEFRALYGSGADPVILLQDLLSLVHFITRIKLAPDSANDIAYSENERNFGKDLAQKLPIAILTKAWQMLLKGLQETRIAPEPDCAAEMVLIRIAHSADLPTPSDLIRIIRKQEPLGTAATTSTSSVSSHKAPVSLISTQQTVLAPAVAAAPATNYNAMPQAFTDAVQLFSTRREPLLYNYLMRDSQLVKFEKGRIELNVSSEVPVDFAGRVGKCLTDWTGQRWLVILSREAGAIPLQQQLESADLQKRDAIKTHPLVAAALEQFPGAEVTQIINKE
jgi:DNA polymerase-3 subunit gamma/tau